MKLEELEFAQRIGKRIVAIELDGVDSEWLVSTHFTRSQLLTYVLTDSALFLSAFVVSINEQSELKQIYGARVLSLRGLYLPEVTADGIGPALLHALDAEPTVTRQHTALCGPAHEWNVLMRSVVQCEREEAEVDVKRPSDTDRWRALALARCKQHMRVALSRFQLLHSDPQKDQKHSTAAGKKQLPGLTALQRFADDLHSRTAAYQAAHALPWDVAAGGTAVEAALSPRSKAAASSAADSSTAPGPFLTPLVFEFVNAVCACESDLHCYEHER